MTFDVRGTIDVTGITSPSMMLAQLGGDNTAEPVAGFDRFVTNCPRRPDADHILARASTGTNQPGLTTIYCIACAQFGTIARSDLPAEHVFPWQLAG